MANDSAGDKRKNVEKGKSLEFRGQIAALFSSFILFGISFKNGRSKNEYFSADISHFHSPVWPARPNHEFYL
jgi:hypothetical protein